MIPFQVKVGGTKVWITLESLVWFFLSTAAATVAGSIAYYYLQGFLPALPKITASKVAP
ncbi:MAG: hypothetical protein ACRDQZ_26540 [Mycobacteriales bacterium]